MKRNKDQLSLIGGTEDRTPPPGAIARDFDSARLTQARHLAGMTKKEVADAISVTAAAVGQYEAGMRPRPDLIPALAETLNVPPVFFLPGRPHARLDASMAHFRSLRSTRAFQRAKAIAFVEQVWEVTHALERWVRLPYVEVPGFSGGESSPPVDTSHEPRAAARLIRQQWNLGSGPVRHLIRTMESHGIVTAMVPFDDVDVARVDAFGTSRLPRPVIVLTPDRAKDVYRHRFTAAHELGHLILHGETAPGDYQQEREADAFAAEFLTPMDSIKAELPPRVDFTALIDLQLIWGVSVKSLLYRCREVGQISDSAASRGYQRLNTLQASGMLRNEPTTSFPGELPSVLKSAFDLAGENGLTLPALANELAWYPSRVRTLLSQHDRRPTLRVVPSEGLPSEALG
jgi:Zn-dependent peptidase ImmA (M78 family)/transcriptional regulator with XRE-family HTH domain